EPSARVWSGSRCRPWDPRIAIRSTSWGAPWVGTGWPGNSGKAARVVTRIRLGKAGRLLGGSQLFGGDLEYRVVEQSGPFLPAPVPCHYLPSQELRIDRI